MIDDLEDYKILAMGAISLSLYYLHWKPMSKKKKESQ